MKNSTQENTKHLGFFKNEYASMRQKQREGYAKKMAEAKLISLRWGYGFRKEIGIW